MTERAADLLGEIAADAKTISELTQRQERRIVEAHREGASLRELAAAAGLSHMSIKRIIERTK